jgi:hypothetical protein
MIEWLDKLVRRLGEWGLRRRKERIRKVIGLITNDVMRQSGSSDPKIYKEQLQACIEAAARMSMERKPHLLDRNQLRAFADQVRGSMQAEINRIEGPLAD